MLDVNEPIEKYLRQLITRIKDSDELILISLKDKPPQYGMTIADIMEENEMKRTKVRTGLDGLVLVGAVDYLIGDGFNKYFLTDLGKILIKLLDEQWEGEN